MPTTLKFFTVSFSYRANDVAAYRAEILATDHDAAFDMAQSMENHTFYWNVIRDGRLV